MLALLGIFPQISFKMTRLLGIQSPSNFVFLAVICLLLEKILSLSIQVSQLESKIEIMAAELALRSKDMEEKLEKNETVLGEQGADGKQSVVNTDKL